MTRFIHAFQNLMIAYAINNCDTQIKYFFHDVTWFLCLVCEVLTHAVLIASMFRFVDLMNTLRLSEFEGLVIVKYVSNKMLTIIWS